jgi:pimeloyl-ACP methyl ester carboxylesterase
MKTIFSLFFLLIILPVSAQKKEIVYRDDKDKTQNFYLALLPEKTPKGLLVILPGFGTATPSEILSETKIPDVACQNGYIVVIPVLLDYKLIDKKNIFQERLESLIPDLLKKYKIQPGKFILGGHSIGGTQALFYTEKAIQETDKKIIKPSLVFGVDPPLDFKRLYNSMQRSMDIDPVQAKGGEAEMFTERMRKLYDGSPKDRPQAYARASAFSHDEKDGGNAKYLKTTPLRLYCDPDLNWYIHNRNTPVAYLNLSDLTACIVQLKILGNTKAELITCLGKGFHPDGTRHPHAFSMVDANELVQWINKELYAE